MVAIVSGNGLGLDLTSRNVLGAQGAYGNPTTGQGGEQVYVNAATGNLVMQQLQDELVGAGPDIASVLSYNSQGQLTDDNGDNFSLGKVPVQLKLTGAVNTAGSTLTRTSFDGTQTVFTWDATHSRYVAINGASGGAFDTITYSASRYTWLAGATQQTETYDGATGNLLTRSDAAGNSVTFGYTGSLLTSVTDANGETVTYVYSGTLLTQIKAPVTTWVGGVATTSVQPVVTYGYDTSNRLQTVMVDLSPDGSTSDRNVYITSYTYDGTSKRVHSVSQTDGTSLTFIYDGSNRVSTITDALGNVTTFAYDTANAKTSVTANGQATVYAYDANGQLLSVTAPAVNGSNPVTKYSYNANGELTLLTDPDGNVSSYGYDASGNQTTAFDGAGNQTTRTFDAQNRLLTESTSTLTRPVLTANAAVTVSGRTVTKTGSTNAWDDSVRSVNSVTGAATASFAAPSATSVMMVGLSTNPDANVAQSFQSIDYGLYLNSGQLIVYSSGVQVKNLGISYGAGDRFSVSYDGFGHVNFVRNGSVLYSMASTPAKPLYFQAAFNTTAASIENLTFGAGAMVDQALVADTGSTPVTVAGGVATKTGSATAWDASVRSASSLTGATAVSFAATSSTSVVMVGLSTNPNTTVSQSFQSIDYGLYLQSGQLMIFSSGVLVSNLGISYATGDRFSVSYDGSGHVNFYQNGHVVYSMASTPAKALFLQAAFNTPGASISDLSFGTGQPIDQTTRYVYSADGKGLLHYTISPEGRVTEFGYNAQGQLTSTIDYPAGAFSTPALAANLSLSEANMNAWRSVQDLTKIARTDISRDSRQQVSSTTRWTATNSAGVGVAGSGSTTTFIYDPSGRLIQTVQPGSATTNYAYDGLGRVTSTTDALGRITTTSYADATGTIAVTYANQLVTTTKLDKDGRVISTTNASSGNTLSQATVDYDALGNVLRTTDATGMSTWYLYDVDGRRVASIDSTGALTELMLDRAGLVTETIAYATKINTALLVDGTGKPSNPSLASVRPAFNATTDHRSWTVYDSEDRVSQTIDATGAVTQFTYDSAGRLLATRTFATTVDVSAFSSAPAFQFVAPSSADRIARNFHDADGHLVGTLDPDNYLTAYQYDAAGQLTTALKYATASPAATDQSTLSQLVPAAAPGDQRSVTLYDAEGRVTGQIDPLGYLTQTFYNPRNTVDHVTRYATAVGTAVAAGSDVNAIKPASTSADTTTSYVYDAADRVTSETDPAGIVTTYAYDAATNELIGSTVGAGRADAATTQTRYDAMGRPIAVLDAVSSALITSGMTQAQIDAVWAAHATTTAYDLAGRRTSVKDALGNTTLYFYDGDGQLRYTVDPLNDVTELRYDAFGNVNATVRYATAINPANIGAGGLITSNLTAAVAAVANASKDLATRTVYDVDGRVSVSVDGTGAATAFTYDAFGNVTQTRQYATKIPTGSALQVTNSSTANSSAELFIGTFNAGDVITATVRFKAAAGLSGGMYLGNQNNESSNVTVTATGGWVTMTITHTMTTTSGMIVFLPTAQNGTRAPVAGDTVLYDDLTVSSAQQGTTISQSFDSMTAGSGVGQWQYVGTTQQVQVSPADAGPDAPLMLFVASLGDTSRDIVSRNVYDADGRVTLSVDPTGAATAYTYDAFGNVTQTRQYATKVPTGGALEVDPGPSGDTYAMTFLGSFPAGDVLTASVRYHGPATQAGLISVGANSSQATTSSDGWTTLNVSVTVPADGGIWLSLHALNPNGGAALYDDLKVTSARSGVVLQTSFDSILAGTGVGQWYLTWAQAHVSPVSAGSDAALSAFVASLADPTRDRTTSNQYDAEGRLVYSVDALGHARRNVYDAQGRLACSIGPDGSFTSNQYDADGRLVQTKTYANQVSAPTLATLAHALPLSQQALLTPTASSSDSTTQYAYDSLGRLLFSMDGTGGLTQFTYDADGNVTDQVTFANQATWNAGAAPSVVPDAAHDRHVHSSYDAAGRVIAQSDGTGAVVVNTYDADGNLTDRRRYANRIVAGSWTSGQLPALNPDDTRDIHERYAYNALGQLTFSADGTGAVTGYVYDADGRVIQRTAFVTPVTSGQSLASVTTGQPNDRVDRFSYDAFGRQVWHADPMGALDYTAYDADGRAIETIQYAQPSTGPLPTAPLPPGPLDRVTRVSYNAFGQVSCTVDPLNRVSLDTYDQAGRLSTSTRFATPIAAGADPTTVVPNSALDETTTFNIYDGVGRLLQQTDAMGNTQRYVYDGVGNRIKWFDLKSQEWDYAYDAAGREVMQTSPLLSITTNAVNGSGDLVGSSADASISTSMLYDGTGNLRQRTEAAGRPEARVTQYDYDAAGHETTVTGPAFNSYDSSGNLVSSTAPVSRAFYDAFGNEVATVDPLGNITCTTYDQANRVAFTVDALGYVVGTNARNAFGEVLVQTQYGAATTTLIGTVPSSAAGVPTSGAVAAAVAALPHAADRVTTYGYVYNGTGHTESIAGMSTTLADGTTATPTTTNRYDAFGDLVLSTQQVDQARSASTYHYFDAAGQETDTVDALGYETHRTFDAFGNVTQSVEYATAMAGGTYGMTGLSSTPVISTNDRVTSSVFDRLGRMTSQTRRLDYSASDDGVISGHSVTTQWGYDAEGHVTRMTDASGAVTYSEYDALGRLCAIIAPTRSSTIDGSAITPVTEYGYDAFGATTVTAQRAASASGTSEFTGVWTAAGAKGYTVSTGASDRVTRTLYDGAGHAVQVDDPMASTTNFHNTWNYYDADGNLTYTRHMVEATVGDTVGYRVDTGYKYDARGQVIATVAPTGSGSGIHEVTTQAKYNAFGEMTARGIGGLQEFYTYDNNGLLWMTNQGDGVVHAYLHDLMANVTADATSDGVGGNLDVTTYTTQAALAAALPNLRVTFTQHDLLGHVTAYVEAKRLDTAGQNLITPTVNQVCDRWGNVISRSDPDSAQAITTYAYNSANQLIQQVLPGVSVTTAGTTQIAVVSPTTRYFYDAMGRLAATLDADGNLSGQLHDAAGQVVETDSHPTAATLVKTVSQYDIFGRKVRDIAADAFTPTADQYAAPGTTMPTQADYTTQYAYDMDDDLTSVQHGVGSGTGGDVGSVAVYSTTASTGYLTATGGGFQNLLESYVYDADGHRLSSAQGTTSALGPATTYAYDAAGHLVSTTLPSVNGVASVTLFGYDDLGHQSSQTDADGHTANWTYDYFGTRITDHYDFGRTHYAYSYDNAGKLLTQTSSGGSTGGGQNLAYTYDAAGQQTKVVDSATGTTSSYTYDAAGNRMSEATVQGGVSYQNNHLNYDADGRLTSSNDGTVSVAYNYDAVGNRTHVATTLTLSGKLTTDGVSVPASSDYWFTYDGMNRQTGADLTGVVNAGTVALSLGTNGHQLGYDADGNRVSDTFSSSRKVVITNPSPIIGYDTYGDPIYGVPSGATTYGAITGQVTETYAYDALDRLRHSYRDGFLFDTELYDAAGRAVVEGPNPAATDVWTVKVLNGWANDVNTVPVVAGAVVTSNKDTVDVDTRLNVYDAQGRLASVQVGSQPAVSVSNTSYAVHRNSSGVQDRGYDAAGNLLGYETVAMTYIPRVEPTGAHEAYTVDQRVTTDETYGLAIGEYAESVMDSRNQASTAYDEFYGTTTTSNNTLAVRSAYDADGHLSTVSVASQTTSAVVVTYDSGKAPTSTAGTPSDTTKLPTQYVYAADGQVLSRTATGAGSLQSRSLVINGELLGVYGVVMQPMPIGTTLAQETAEFDNGYRSLHDSSVTASVGSYTARAGDTLQSIAESAYGDSSLWERIAMANGVSSDRDLHAGLTLRLPTATASHSSAGASKDADSLILATQMPVPHLPKVRGLRAPPTIVQRGSRGGDFTVEGMDPDQAAMMAMNDAPDGMDVSVGGLTSAANNGGSIYSGQETLSTGLAENAAQTIAAIRSAPVPAAVGIESLTPSDVSLNLDELSVAGVGNAGSTTLDGNAESYTERNGMDVASDTYDGSRQGFSVKKGEGPLKAFANGGLDSAQSMAMYGQAARSGQFGFDAKGMPIVSPGQMLYVDLDDTSGANLGRMLVSNESGNRATLAQQAAQQTAVETARASEIARDPANLGAWGFNLNASPPSSFLDQFPQIDSRATGIAAPAQSGLDSILADARAAWDGRASWSDASSMAWQNGGKDFASAGLHSWSAGMLAEAAGLTAETGVLPVFLGGLAVQQADVATAASMRFYGSGDAGLTQPFLTTAIASMATPAIAQRVEAEFDLLAGISALGTVSRLPNAAETTATGVVDLESAALGNTANLLDVPARGAGSLAGTGIDTLDYTSPYSVARQTTNWECAAACTRGLLIDAGHVPPYASVSDIGDIIGTVPDASGRLGGTTISGIPARLQSELGVNSQYLQPKTVDELFSATGESNPFMATIRVNNGESDFVHAIIVDGRVNGIVNIRDPWSLVPNAPTSYALPQVDFAKIFNNQAFVLGPY